MATHGEQQIGDLADTDDMDEMVEAVGRAFRHPHEVVHLILTATDEDDATIRIAKLLELDDGQVGPIMDQPLRNMLPERRNNLGAVLQPAD